MKSEVKLFLEGCIMEDQHELTLGELSRACAVHAECIIALVEEGILEPAGREATGWRFSGASLQKARTALRLQRDLGVNLAGAALVLDLMEEIHNLRTRLNRVR